MQDKEEFLIQLEQTFDNLSWDQILSTVNEATDIEGKDNDVINNIIDYVKKTNRISFKQWKVLRCYIKDNSQKNYKYGNQ